jgi:hypothetical protein
MSLFIVYHRWP